MIGHRLERDVVENRKVVAVADGLLEDLVSFPGKLVKSILALFAMQDGPVKLVLGCKMSENNGFGNASGAGYLFCGSTFKAFLRK